MVDATCNKMTGNSETVFQQHHSDYFVLHILVIIIVTSVFFSVIYIYILYINLNNIYLASNYYHTTITAFEC